METRCENQQISTRDGQVTNSEVSDAFILASYHLNFHFPKPSPESWLFRACDLPQCVTYSRFNGLLEIRGQRRAPIWNKALTAGGQK